MDFCKEHGMVIDPKLGYCIMCQHESWVCPVCHEKKYKSIQVSLHDWTTIYKCENCSVLFTDPDQFRESNMKASLDGIESLKDKIRGLEKHIIALERNKDAIQ